MSAPSNDAGRASCTGDEAVGDIGEHRPLGDAGLLARLDEMQAYAVVERRTPPPRRSKDVGR